MRKKRKRKNSIYREELIRSCGVDFLKPLRAQRCHQLTDLPPLHPDRSTFLKAAGVHLQAGEWRRAGVGCGDSNN